MKGEGFIWEKKGVNVFWASCDILGENWEKGKIQAARLQTNLLLFPGLQWGDVQLLEWPDSSIEEQPLPCEHFVLHISLIVKSCMY